MRVSKIKPPKTFDTEPFQKALFNALPPEKRRMQDGDIHVVEGKGCLVVFIAFRSHGRTMIAVHQGHGQVIQTNLEPQYYGEEVEANGQEHK